MSNILYSLVYHGVLLNLSSRFHAGAHTELDVYENLDNQYSLLCLFYNFIIFFVQKERKRLHNQNYMVTSTYTVAPRQLTAGLRCIGRSECAVHLRSVPCASTSASS